LRLASLNLGRRLRYVSETEALPRWLHARDVDILCVQEATGSKTSTPNASIPGYEFVDGHAQVAVFARPSLTIGSTLLVKERWLTIDVGYLTVHNLYLSARSAAARTAILDDLARAIGRDVRETHLLVGDFNLAPRPVDGLVDGRASRFTTLHERRAFSRLLHRANLVDLGAKADSPVYTRDTHIAGRRIQFRCDLGLLSRSCVDGVQLTYDHTVRSSSTAAFTDHSALLVDLPVSVLSPSARFIPGNTAKPRVRPSRIALRIMPAAMAHTGARTVLDFGCGRGRDIEHYRALGLDARGYDAHVEHGFSMMPATQFDLVVMTYVLNTLPDPGARVAALASAISKVRRRGYLLVAVRDKAEVGMDARARGWDRVNDGYYTSRRRGTFVKGMTSNEVLACLPPRPRVDVVEADLPRSRGSEVVLLRRR
jgi:exonuclease III